MDDTATSSPDLRAILERQRRAFLAGPAPDLASRRADLTRLRQEVLACRTEIETAISADFGHRSRHETAIMELLTLVQGIDYLIRNLRRFMRPERRRVGLTHLPARAWVEYHPLGVVGIISPWNYPLSLALMPLATALAAGNRVMLKPSELVPQTTALMSRMLARLFAPEQVAVIAGPADVAAAFASLPFDHLFFTGSPRVGRMVMEAAALHLVPVTLELGGKSPAIIAPGEATAAHIAHIAFGKLANAGQTCVAPDYVLLHRDDLQAFADGFDLAVRALYPDGPASPDYSAIINDHHLHRLRALVEDAVAKGARIISPGAFPGEAVGQKFPPLLVLDPTPDMALLRDEIFGPILPVLTYDRPEEVVAHVNAGARPLALYYFGTANADRAGILARCTAGNVGLNNTLLHYAQNDLPFGGVGGSGMGAYHGIEGFRRLSHARGVYQPGRWNATPLLRAPYGQIADRILKILLRRR